MGWLSDFKRRCRRDRLMRKAPAEVFERYYRSNKWGDRESRSGKGSSLAATVELRPKLEALLVELNIGMMLDVPCGDFHWMAHVDLGRTQYLGGDIVPGLIADNIRHHSCDSVTFQVIDLITGPIPSADLILVRDCLVHLSNDHVLSVLTQIASSGSTYLLTTTFPSVTANDNIATGEWRAVNLTLPPFSLPAPLRLIAEGAEHQKGQGRGKMLGLWRIDKLQALRS